MIQLFPLTECLFKTGEKSYRSSIGKLQLQWNKIEFHVFLLV